MLDMTLVCDKCGKPAPVDEKMSTSVWKVYNVKEPCECGGKFTPKFLLDKEKDENATD